MSQLNSKQVRHLRSLAHHLDPVVHIGKHGVTEAVTNQVNTQLLAHELIKVRFGQEAPVDVKEARADLAAATNSNIVQTAGRVLVLFRRNNTKPKVELPGDKLRGAGPGKDPRLSLRRKHAEKRRRAKAQSATSERSREDGDRTPLSRLRRPRPGPQRG